MDYLSLFGAKAHGLLEGEILNVSLHYTFDRMVRGIGQFSSYRQHGPVGGRQVELSEHNWITESDGTRGGDVHVTPDAHFFIWRHRGPIDERNGQVMRLRRKDLDGERVGFARLRGSRNIELKQSPGAGELSRGGDLHAIHPHVRPVVDTVETKPYCFPVVFRREFEFGAIPPGLPEGTARRHRNIGEVLKYRVCRAGDGAQVHAGIGIRVHLVLDQCAYYRRRHGRGIPAVRGKPSSRDLCPVCLHIG